MPWQVLIRQGPDIHKREVDDLAAAIAVACVLLQQDIEVMRIEGSDGLRIDTDVICSTMCRTACARNGRIEP